MDWRDLIHQYLIACDEDFHENLRRSTMNRTRAFIVKHGTSEFNELDIQWLEKSLKPRRKPQSPDTYKIIDENRELIIVEGAPHSFHLQPKQRDLRSEVLGFFDKYLKPID